jgi:hypothetical protein
LKIRLEVYESRERKRRRATAAAPRRLVPRSARLLGSGADGTEPAEPENVVDVAPLVVLNCEVRSKVPIDVFPYESVNVPYPRTARSS